MVIDLTNPVVELELVDKLLALPTTTDKDKLRKLRFIRKFTEDVLEQKGIPADPFSFVSPEFSLTENYRQYLKIVLNIDNLRDTVGALLLARKYLEPVATKSFEESMVEAYDNLGA